MIDTALGLNACLPEGRHRCVVCDNEIHPLHDWLFVSHGFTMHLCEEDSVPVMREARAAAEREVMARRSMYGKKAQRP